LAYNFEAYTFVCSCHHCHRVLGPPPTTTISQLSRAYLPKRAQNKE
jgi:hypothetical protein